MSDTRKQYPRALVISHNVFSNNTNMGKTLGTYFSDWDPECLAQLFFHSEVPTSNICRKYYQFTDTDALRSVLFRSHHGKMLTEKDIDTARADASDTGALAGIYNYGRRRSPMIYLMRDNIWKFSAWESKELLQWIEAFSPEVIFCASGDYEFIYRIAGRLSEQFSIPLVMCCFDDYYLFNGNENRFLGRYRQKRYMKVVNWTMKRAACIVTVNDMMSEGYEGLFGQKCPVLYTAAKARTEQVQDKKGLAYIGGLGLERDKQLITIARVLKEIDHPLVPRFIDVYSGETDHTILGRIEQEERIHFHGAVRGDEVSAIISRCKAVIHTESFDPIVRQRVKYSLSTKIPDSIASGTCLLAYGPREVASIDYLVRNDAAFVATSRDELRKTILRLFTDEKEYNRIATNALSLANKNHDSETITRYFRALLCEAAGIKS